MPASVHNLAAVLAYAGVALLAACSGPADESADPMGMMGARGPVPVVVASATSERFVGSYTALGNARANEAVDITSRVSSVVRSIHFTDGQAVDRGDLLVQLDDREISAQLAVAQAAFEKVSSQYQRSKSLRETRVVSEAELDELAADMRRTEADIRAARARLDDSSITAPIAGYVGLRRVSPGELVNPDTVITTLDDTRTMKIDFAVPEVFLSTISRGMAVVAKTEAYPGTEFAGEVNSVDSRIDPVTRSITVVAVVPNPDNLLKPGMFMTVALQRARDNVLFVPEQALAPRSGRQYVYVVRAGKVFEQEVELGIRTPGRAEIVSGLEAGMQVVIEGVQKVRTGAAVEIINSNG